LVDVRGFEGLITQHYPRKGVRQATFDLVLEPEIKGAKPGDRARELVTPGKKP
jgi:catechol 1,2-dioxygenase